MVRSNPDIDVGPHCWAREPASFLSDTRCSWDSWDAYASPSEPFLPLAAMSLPLHARAPTRDWKMLARISRIQKRRKCRRNQTCPNLTSSTDAHGVPPLLYLLPWRASRTVVVVGLLGSRARLAVDHYDRAGSCGRPLIGHRTVATQTAGRRAPGRTCRGLRITRRPKLGTHAPHTASGAKVVPDWIRLSHRRYRSHA